MLETSPCQIDMLEIGLGKVRASEIGLAQIGQRVRILLAPCIPFLYTLSQNVYVLWVCHVLFLLSLWVHSNEEDTTHFLKNIKFVTARPSFCSIRIATSNETALVKGDSMGHALYLERIEDPYW